MFNGRDMMKARLTDQSINHDIDIDIGTLGQFPKDILNIVAMYVEIKKKKKKKKTCCFFALSIVPFSARMIIFIFLFL